MDTRLNKKKRSLKSRVKASSKKVKSQWGEYAASKSRVKKSKVSKKEKPAKGTAAYHMSDEYKKKVLKGRKPGAAKKASRKYKVKQSVSKVKSKISELSQGGRRKKIGASKGIKVRKGAAGVQKTKGGEYVKYEKGSKAAGSFRSAFKKGCAAGAASFTWDGRKYSCKKK